jgi:hypothetical protein
LRLAPSGGRSIQALPVRGGDPRRNRPATPLAILPPVRRHALTVEAVAFARTDGVVASG